MEADSTQDSSFSGSSVSIRAPLTIDSDSELNLSINGHNYSRTSSFNSSSSSIDLTLSSYEQDDESFEAYPDDEIVKESLNVEQNAVSRAFVNYPDGNCVKESGSLGKNDIFRRFEKYPDGNCVKESDGFDKNVVFRTLVNYPYGDSVKESSSSLDKNEIFRGFEKYPDEDCVKESSGLDKKVGFRPFVKYADGEYVKESGGLDKNDVFRRFEKYPDGNCVKESGSLDKNAVFRSFVKYTDGNVKERSDFDKNVVKYPSEESSSGDLGMKLGLGVPVARLTSDGDSDIDSDSVSVDGLKWLVSGGISLDGIVQKVGVVPKARIFSGDELQVEGVFSGDDVTGIEELKSVLAESIEDEGCRFDCLNEVVGFSESDEISVDFGIIDEHIVSNSNSEMEIETITVKLPESDKLSCDLESIDARNVPSSDNEIEIETISVKLSESDELSCELERIDVHIVSNSDNETEIETISVKLPEPDNLSFGEKVDSLIVSDSNNEIAIETINVKIPESDELSFGEKVDLQIVSDSNDETKIETMNMELSESDESSFDLENFDAHISPNSENEIAIETISENKQGVVFDCYRNESKTQLNEKGDETRVKMQTRENFLRFAIDKQLTTKVNGKDEFDFHLTILVIGKTGAGKSATINSIFGETKTSTNAFISGTTTIQEITGKVDGIQLRVLDTPGFKSSPSERSYNLRILKSIKKFTRKHTPNVVLYVDRLDTYTQDVNDSQLLTLITSSLGSSVWSNCIIALTHAASNPPDESSGRFVFQRSCFVQEQIVNSGDTNRHMSNPVWLIENHPSYQQDRSKLFELSGLEGLTCFDRANEDERESVEVIKGSVERKKVYFKDHGYRVKLLGNRHWSLACRLYS